MTQLRRSTLRLQFLLAAMLALSVAPCAAAQVRVNPIGAGHVIAGHVGGSGQLLPYIRSTQGAGSGHVSQGGANWHGGNTQSPQWGGRAAATGSSGSGGWRFRH